MKVCSRLSASFYTAFLALLFAMPCASAQTGSATFSPTSVTLNGVAGGAQVTQNVTLSISGAPNTAFSVGIIQQTGASYNWLSVAPPASTSYTTDNAGNATLTVRADPSQLPANTYQGAIYVYVNGQQSGTPLQVTFNVTGQSGTNTLQSTPANLSFVYQQGSAVPPTSQVVTLTTNPAAANVPIAANVQLVNGTTQQFVQVSAYSPTTNLTGPNGTISLLIAPIQSVISTLPAGTYTNNVVVSGTGYGSTTIPVTLTVTNTPQVTAAPASMTFNFNQNSTAVQTQPLVLSNAGIAQNYSATVTYPNGQQQQGFVSVSPATGSAPGALIVTANPSGLPNGSYTANVVLTFTNAQGGTAAQQITVPVTVNVSNNPYLTFSPNALTFAYQIGQNQSLPSQTITLYGTQGNTATNYTATIVNSNNVPFVTFTTPTGSGFTTVSGTATANAPATLTLAVNPAGLAAGVYTATVNIQVSPFAQPIAIPITLIVSQSQVLQVSPNALTFNYQSFSSPPATQNLTVTSTSGSVSFNVTTTGGFLQAINASATVTAGQPIMIPVAVNPLGLQDGTYTGYVTITPTSGGTQNTPIVVPVTLTVTTNSSLTISSGNSTIQFQYTLGGSAPATQQVTVNSTGLALPVNVAVTYPSANSPQFLNVQQSSTITPSTLTLSINTAALTNVQPGTYSAVVNISSGQSSGNSTVYSIPVILTVAPSATLAVSSPSGGLTYNFTIGGSAPATQTVQLTASNNAAISFTAKANQPFITVTPTSGTTPATLTIGVNPTNLTAGPYSGSVTITSPGAGNTITIPVNLTVSAVMAGNIAAVVNAASQQPGLVSPGELITIYGTNLGPTAAVFPGLTNNNTAFPTSAGNVQVTFDGIPAPLTYVSATQINAIVPYEVANRASTTLAVTYNGVQSNALSFRLQNTSPGIFTANASGTGQAAAQLPNYSANNASNPVSRGGVITLYATGEGLTTPATTGGITPVLPVSQLPTLNNAPVTVLLGTPGTNGNPGNQVQAQVLYAGEAPGLVAGVMQINILIPQNAPTGPNVPVTVQVGGQSSQNGVTIAIQ